MAAQNRPVIVGIHGLANKPEPERLAQWWERSIKEGLAKNCDIEAADFEYRMVYWANFLYKHQLHEESGFDFDRLYNKQPYLEAKEGALKSHQRTWRDGARKILGRIVGPVLDWVRGRVGRGAFTHYIMRKRVKDLEFYYDEERKIVDDPTKQEKTKREAREVLMDVLKEELRGLKERRIMLIAHSMGSIIAYDVLRDLGRPEPELEVAHFVTIGSPLGLPEVKKNVYEKRKSYAEEPVRTPTIVNERWVNYADPGDLVSLDAFLKDDFGPNDKGVRVSDVLVQNDYVSPKDKSNPHKSYGYLRTPEVSAHIKAFLGL